MSDAQRLDSTCYQGHPMWAAAEGYAYCVEPGDSQLGRSRLFYAWKLTAPRDGGWMEMEIDEGIGRTAWVLEPGFASRAECVAFIARHSAGSVVAVSP